MQVRSTIGSSRTILISLSKNVQAINFGLQLNPYFFLIDLASEILCIIAFTCTELAQAITTLTFRHTDVGTYLGDKECKKETKHTTKEV
jgi:hypothetical protein